MKPITLSEDLCCGQDNFPLVVRPADGGGPIGEYTQAIGRVVAEELSRRGALLFRGFAVDGLPAFEAFIRNFGSDLLTYEYGSTPRTHLSGGVYTSTEYPAQQTIPLHNEMAYTTSWPLKIWFHSVIPASKGGETPLANSRRIFQLIPPDLRDKFNEKKLMYVRNYRIGMDLSWQKTFNTDDKDQVARYCRRSGIDFEWRNGNELRTREICQAVARHPTSGDDVWFNQAHLFHISNLAQPFLDAMRSLYKGDDELPRNVLFADGTPIPDEDLNRIRAIIQDCKLAFPWEKSDILLVDNMLVAHGRNPYEGDRKVVVAMTEAYPAA